MQTHFSSENCQILTAVQLAFERDRPMERSMRNSIDGADSSSDAARIMAHLGRYD